MLFDPNDRARSFLSADNALLWSKQTVSNNWQFPETLGAIHDHSSLERLDVDLDGNGSTETILRRWYEIKGQKYNRIFLDSNPTSSSTPTSANTLIDETQLQKLVADVGQPGIEIDSSYYLFELMVEDKRLYVAALSTIFSGDQSSDRPAYIVKYSPQMTPSLVCVLRTITH
jgi:hypothetical protein